MTQFPNTTTSLQFDPRSTTGEVNNFRRDNQIDAESAENSRFARTLDDSNSQSNVRSEVGRDDTQAPVRDGSPRENEVRNGQAENTVEENTVEQDANSDLGNDETETDSLETATSSEQDTTEQSNVALFDPFSLIEQLTNETTPAGTNAAATDGALLASTDSTLTASTDGSLLTSTAIAGFLPSGETAGGVATAQQNLATTLQGASNPLQAGTLGQNVAPQADNALAQANGIVANVAGEAFDNVLTNQLSNTGAQTTATSPQALAGNLPTNLQQTSAASSLQSTQLSDLVQQNAGAASADGEQLNSFSNTNQSSATPAQQLASLLAGTGNADAPLPNLGQLTNGPLQQATQAPVQQAAQPLAQFANAAFANDTVPAFTAQISRNFAAGQDSFNVRLNPSELGRVDVRLITNEDGSVNTQIRVERSETLDLFQRDIRALERTLQQSGLKLGSEGIDLSLKDNGADQGGNNQAFDNDFDGQGEQAQNSDPALEAEDANQQLGNDGLLVDDLAADVPLDQVQTIYARYQPGQLNIRV